MEGFTGKLIVFTAPSGAGKTTIVRHLLKHFDELAFSVSATSRSRRPHEEEGRDYYFLSPEAFRQRVEAGDFIEWEEVYEHQYYGTLKSEVERLWQARKHILFDIDVYGALNIKRIYGERALTVFVKPPSLDVLYERLQKRKTETPASLKKRLKKAQLELGFEKQFDRVVVNDVLAKALAEAAAIVQQFIG